MDRSDRQSDGKGENMMDETRRRAEQLLEWSPVIERLLALLNDLDGTPGLEHAATRVAHVLDLALDTVRGP